MSDVTYEPVIGLEIHVQLSTRTKMFCRCELSFGEEPNTRTCPVCLGLPGTLPTPNAEASANLARYDGVRYGARSGDGELLSLYEQTRHDGFGAEVKRRIMIGTYALSSGYYDAYYGQAQKVRTLISRDFAAAFERVDLVVCPTSPTVAFKLGERTDNPLAMYLSDVLTVPMSLAGIPAICSPVGSPSASPLGIETAGMPARLMGTAQKSLRYIASGSSSLAPSSKATVGLVGVTTKSTSSQARAKSRLISVRTFWARP